MRMCNSNSFKVTRGQTNYLARIHRVHRSELTIPIHRKRTDRYFDIEMGQICISIYETSFDSLIKFIKK